MKTMLMWILLSMAACADPFSVLPVRQLDVVHLQQAIVANGNPESVLSSKLTPEQVDVLRRFGNLPDGPQRYADSVLMGLSDLSDTQRAMLTPLITSVESSPAQQKRFWRMAYLILTPGQARTITSHLPLGLQHGPDPNTWFGLPNLSAAQISRIRARFTEFEAATEPLMRAAKGADVPHQLATQVDILTRYQEVESDLNAALTPEQRATRLELPPLTQPQELEHAMGDLMDAVQLTPDQAQQVQAWLSPLQAVQAEAEARAKGSPDMMAMRGVRDKMLAAQLTAARQLVSILTDEQRVAWISKP